MKNVQKYLTKKNIIIASIILAILIIGLVSFILLNKEDKKETTSNKQSADVSEMSNKTDDEIIEEIIVDEDELKLDNQDEDATMDDVDDTISTPDDSYEISTD